MALATSPEVREWQTERCSIRPFEESDAASLSAVLNRSARVLDRWVGVRDRGRTEADALAEIRRVRACWDEGTNFVMAIVRDGRLVGGTGFHPRDGRLGVGTTEVGMWLATEAMGQGIATEVLRGLLREAFTRWDWHRVEWRCEPANRASVAVAEKVGLHLDGRLRQCSVDRRGERCDLLVFSRLRSDPDEGTGS